MGNVSAHTNASVHISSHDVASFIDVHMCTCPSAVLPASSSQALMQLQPRRQALEDQVQYACMELLEDDEVWGSVGALAGIWNVWDCSRTW